MYNSYARFTHIVTVAGTVLFVCAVALGISSFLTDYFFRKEPIVKLAISPQQQKEGDEAQLPRLNVVYAAKLGMKQTKTERIVHRTYFKFDIDADFTMCFDWNTKLVYVAVVATYSTPKYPRNEVTIWDNLILTKEQAQFSHRGLMVEYPLDDIEQGLRGITVTCKVAYQIMMYSGYAPVRSVVNATASFILPDEPVSTVISHGGL